MSPALHIWLKRATEKPNWLSGMSLPLLENKIENRECVPLPNVTQAGGRAPASWQSVPGRNAVSDWLAWTRGRGHDPFNPMLPDNLPNLGKIHFQDEKPGSPRLEMLYPVSFGTVSPSFWQIQGVFMKKTIIIFK